MILLNCTVIKKYNYILNEQLKRIIIFHYINWVAQMNAVYYWIGAVA